MEIDEGERRRGVDEADVGDMGWSVGELLRANVGGYDGVKNGGEGGGSLTAASADVPGEASTGAFRRDVVEELLRIAWAGCGVILGLLDEELCHFL